MAGIDLTEVNARVTNAAHSLNMTRAWRTTNGAGWGIPPMSRSHPGFFREALPESHPEVLPPDRSRIYPSYTPYPLYQSDEAMAGGADHPKWCRPLSLPRDMGTTRLSDYCVM
jgi:hypothetical protein